MLRVDKRETGWTFWEKVEDHPTGYERMLGWWVIYDDWGDSTAPAWVTTGRNYTYEGLMSAEVCERRYLGSPLHGWDGAIPPPEEYYTLLPWVQRAVLGEKI